jgi:hypothetical protein
VTSIHRSWFQVSHEQWKCEVNEFAKHGPEGVMIPNSVVFNSLKAALEIADDENDSERNSETSDANVDMIPVGGGVLMTLTVNLSKIWKPEYLFQFVSVTLDPIEVLSAQLRDAQEAIRLLQKREAVARSLQVYATLDGGFDNQIVEQHHVMIWNESSTIPLDPQAFTLTADGKDVIVLHSGVYFVNIRCSCHEYLRLLMNGIVVSHCDGAEDQLQSHHITDILQLEKGSHLSVQVRECAVCGYDEKDKYSGRFTIHRLAVDQADEPVSATSSSKGVKRQSCEDVELVSGSSSSATILKGGGKKARK